MNNDAHPRGPSGTAWTQVGDEETPPPDWPPRDDGRPYPKLRVYERADRFHPSTAIGGEPTERARVSGDGRATAPVVLEVSSSTGELPPWESVQSAVDQLSLKGTMFTFWVVAGFPAPTLWRLRQVGTIGDTPAALRFQLTAGAMPSILTDPRGPHGQESN